MILGSCMHKDSNYISNGSWVSDDFLILVRMIANTTDRVLKA